MKTKIILLFTGLITAGAATNMLVDHFELPTAKVTVKVVDEAGNPVKDANVFLAFLDKATAKNAPVRGMTDINGLFSAEGGCNIAGLGTSIVKEGYYGGAASIPRFHERDELLNRWKPWNETYTTILRPIEKPIGLYVRTVETEIPAADKPCGFDLEAGDWVSPYGKGMISDFIFKLHQDWRDVFNYDIRGSLVFKNSLDGLQETSIPEVARNSDFRWDRYAPDNGYQPMFSLQNTWFKSENKKPVRSFKFNDKEWEGYFFRVRTVEQDGKIVSAHYGKIRGGLAVYSDGKSGRPKITFTYYYNPTPNDRNLEWDMKKNLFGGLKDNKTPREP